MTTDTELNAFQNRVGYTFSDRALLRQALTHSSYTNEHPTQHNNERLEFLGDAVLGLIVSDQLYANCWDSSEGELSRKRASLVNTTALAQTARRLEVGPLLSLGRGEKATGGYDKTSLLADTIEAVIGAAYLDGGLTAAQKVVGELLQQDILKISQENPPRDYKSELQEFVQRRHQRPPCYELLAEKGPDHQKRFVIKVTTEEQGPSAIGEGSSKKNAERSAAQDLLETLEQQEQEQQEREQREQEEQEALKAQDTAPKTES